MSCTVRDVAGREVARLLDGVRPAGRHSVSWDAAGVPPGVYLVELEASGAATTARLVKAH